MPKSTTNVNTKPAPARSGFAPVNGLKLYYEIYGAGSPLIMLHGGLGAIDMFGQVIPAMAEGRQIVGVDLQAHGRTADIDRPLSFEMMADDIAALIQYLGLENPDILGYSLGGGVALQTAIRHPELLRKLIVVSTAFKSDNWYPEVRAGMRAMNAAAAKIMIGSPPQQMYARVAPRPEDWEKLVIKVGQLVSQDYDWSEGVKSIKMPAMVVVGDADAIRPSQAVLFFELLGGGQADAGWDGSKMPKARLAVLPGTTHYNIFSSPLLAPIVTAFLDAP